MIDENNSHQTKEKSGNPYIIKRQPTFDMESVEKSIKVPPGNFNPTNEMNKTQMTQMRYTIDPEGFETIDR